MTNQSTRAGRGFDRVEDTSLRRLVASPSSLRPMPSLSNIPRANHARARAQISLDRLALHPPRFSRGLRKGIRQNGSIYSNTFLTISAGASTDSEQGIFTILARNLSTLTVGPTKPLQGPAFHRSQSMMLLGTITVLSSPYMS